ncbi:hypothetical protein VW012_08145 [Phaeobacter sp. JH209B]
MKKQRHRQSSYAISVQSRRGIDHTNAAIDGAGNISLLPPLRSWTAQIVRARLFGKLAPTALIR